MAMSWQIQSQRDPRENLEGIAKIEDGSKQRENTKQTNKQKDEMKSPETCRTKGREKETCGHAEKHGASKEHEVAKGKNERVMKECGHGEGEGLERVSSSDRQEENSTHCPGGNSRCP